MTIEDVSRVAKKYINPSKARIVIVGNKDEVMNKLTAFDKEDGKIQLYDIYANPRKDESGAVVDISAADLVEKYLTAIGGRQKLDAVKSLDQTYSMDLMGTAFTSRVVQMDGKFYMAWSTQGMTAMKQVYDGVKGILEQQGQQVQLEGSDLESVKEQSVVFIERKYGMPDYPTEIKGMEDVNGKACYKLLVTKPSGTKSIEFYDQATNLKVKEVQTSESQGQSLTMTFEYADYKVVEGINVPHTVTWIGLFPTPIVMKASTIKVNGEVDSSLFKI